jgi:hypothetical protein
MPRHAWIYFLVSAFAVLGCSRKSFPPNPKTVPIRGKVLLAPGKPLNGGHLIFHNKDPKRAAIEGHAELETDGTFKASTFGQDDGLVPGSYVVTIEPISYKGKTPKQVNADVIPKKFQKRDTSTLEVEIKEGEEKLPDLVLK